MLPTIIGLLVLGTLTGAGFYLVLRARNMDRWLPAYVRDLGRRGEPDPGRDVHLIICVADHFEPKFGDAPPDQAAARVRRWVEEYPRQFTRFSDSDGRTPRHTFFYPGEEYEPEYLDALAGLCAAGFGEVEIHLHHDRDTPDNLRRALAGFRDTLANRHGLLARRHDGRVAYAFIHGNWALCNSLPGGRHCGVDNELAVLLDTGCYVDMTLPSAPSPAQAPIINRIYHAKDRAGPCAHFHPCPPGEGLMLIQGPLLLDWGRRKFGLIPRVENGCVQRSQPATMDRVRLWLRARVQVPSRPDWYFVKLHAHGAVEDAHGALLGDPMVRFHEALAAEAKRNPRFHYHYVTAREMYNLARAAEDGFRGEVADARDYELSFALGPAVAGAR